MSKLMSDSSRSPGASAPHKPTTDQADMVQAYQASMYRLLDCLARAQDNMPSCAGQIRGLDYLDRQLQRAANNLGMARQVLSNLRTLVKDDVDDPLLPPPATCDVPPPLSIHDAPKEGGAA